MKLLNISWDRLRELENKTVIETLFGALIVGKSTGVLEINNVSTKLESRIKEAIIKKDPVILRELSIEELNKILDRSVETKMMFSLAADTFISLARDMHKIMGNNLTNSSAANIFATILVVFFEYPEIIKIYN